MIESTRIMLRQCSVAILAGVMILIARIFQLNGWSIPFNLLAMFGGLMFAKIVIEKLTGEMFK